MAATLLHTDKTRTNAPPARARGVVAPLVAFGLTLVVIGLLDLGFAWIPAQFGNGEWEFGTISRTFDNLALLTVGAGLLLGAALYRGSPTLLRVLGTIFGLLALALLGAAAIYALNLPLAFRAIPDAARETLTRAVWRTGVFATVYVALYGWLSWFTWRRAGAYAGGVAR
jgi:hypothetical protein